MDLFLARSFHLNYCLNVSENNGKRQREYVNNKKCASFAFGIWNSFTKRRQIVGCLILKGLRRVVAQKKKKKNTKRRRHCQVVQQVVYPGEMITEFC